VEWLGAEQRGEHRLWFQALLGGGMVGAVRGDWVGGVAGRKRLGGLEGGEVGALGEAMD